MRANYFSERSIPLFFLVVTLAAYGLLLPLTGFYWDDWPFAWIAKFLGPWEFIPAFSKVRPFLGPIFFVTTSLIPPVPLYWQIFALLIRFLAGISAWFALRQVWPRHKQQTLVASILFLVFPGYSQHWVAYTHINQEWIPFIFYLLSFGFTARALRRQSVIPTSRKATNPSQPGVSPEPILSERDRLEQPHRYSSDTLFALLLLIAGVFPTEYFVSIEPMRFLFIWVILAERLGGVGQRFIETFKRWLPYFLIWLANGAWLAYFYTIGGYESYDVEVVNQPLSFMSLFLTIGDAIWKAGLYVWAQVLVLAAGSIAAPTTLATVGLIVLSFLGLLIYLKKINLAEGPARTFAVSAIVIGLSGILLGRIPSFAAGLPLTLQSSYDRFMISMMLGGSLFIAGLVELLIHHPRIKTFAFALLIALGIGQQFFNANIFRRDWAKQQEIYWQLAWRIPAMKPNTALLTDQLPIDYETDLGFTAPINWMYAPDYQAGDIPYALFYTEKRLGGAALPSLEPDTKITLPIRRVHFNGTTSQALVIHMPRNGCLRVLDPARGDEITYSRQSRYLVESIPLSDLSNILIHSDPPARIPFLSEPAHTWCFYFAKAELAYQQSDWERVIVLVEEARANGFEPEDPFEWLTYIEALAQTGDFVAAEQISVRALEGDPGVRRGLCEAWKRVLSDASSGGEAQPRLDDSLSRLPCAR